MRFFAVATVVLLAAPAFAGSPDLPQPLSVVKREKTPTYQPHVYIARLDKLSSSEQGRIKIRPVPVHIHPYVLRMK